MCLYDLGNRETLIVETLTRPSIDHQSSICFIKLLIHEIMANLEYKLKENGTCEYCFA